MGEGKLETKYYCNPQYKKRCKERKSKNRHCLFEGHCSQQVIKVKESGRKYKFIKI
jgi:hypothetical protein